MRYQVEIDGEAVAVFQHLSWAKTWAGEYANYSSLGGMIPVPVQVMVIDVITDDVLETWGF